MKSIAFPNIFNATKTILLSDKEAIQSNLRLLIKSDKFSLLGDPYFGTNLKQFIYEPNTVVTEDLIIDEIYTAITTFMPQIVIQRDYIVIERKEHNVYCTIKYIINETNTSNLYTIKLTDTDEA